MTETGDSLPRPEPLLLPPSRETGWRAIPRWLIVLIIVVAVLTIGVWIAAGASFVKVLASARSKPSVTHPPEGQMRRLAQRTYPQFKIVRMTRHGAILQHETLSRLRIDVRYYEKGSLPEWSSQPLEEVAPGVMSNDTFFSHMTSAGPYGSEAGRYDVEAFGRAFERRAPAADAIVEGVWYDRTDDGFDLFWVLMSKEGEGKDPGRPDMLVSIFSWDPMLGWDGEGFKGEEEGWPPGPGKSRETTGQP